MRPQPQPPGPGQESVWEYPRPPALEVTERHVRIVVAGQLVAETHRAALVKETSHPPVYFVSSPLGGPSRWTQGDPLLRMSERLRSRSTDSFVELERLCASLGDT